MSAERLAMRKIREVLRLHFECGIKNGRKIAQATELGKTTVYDYLNRATAVGLSEWSKIAPLDEAELEQLLYPSGETNRASAQAPKRPLPNWPEIHQEFKRKDHHVTLALLWEEYKTESPHGYQYSQFAELYRQWSKKLSISMRQTHRAGEKAFVDYCNGIHVTNIDTGDKTKTELFVGCLGASSYTFAYAAFTQSIPQFIDCHSRMYEFFHGVPAITVPDNLRSGVKTPDRYEAIINPSYQEMAEYYGTCIIPARVRKPKDKVKVEAAVLVAQRWILAVLRNRTFYSLSEMNEAIQLLVEKLNNKIMRAVKKSRLELFEELDRPALKPRPSLRYEFAEWKKVGLNIDYHFTFDDHYYSAPFQLIKEALWVRATDAVIEVFFRGKRITSHARSYVKYKPTTKNEHMPSSHRAHAEWTPSRIIEWGKSIGANTALVIEKVIELMPHPEQGFRSALGIIRLSDKFTKERLEKACKKALSIGSPKYQTIKTMLKNGMEDVEVRAPKARSSLPGSSRPEGPVQLDLLATENIRGKSYYH